MDLQKTLACVVGCVMIVAAVALGIWLALFVMLYGGIMQAITNWGVSNSAVVWGIIRAVFFELGAIPAWLVALCGFFVLKEAA